MIDTNTLDGIVIGGSILGSLGRLMFPYLRKLKDAEDSGTTVTYKHRYTFTAIFSAVVSAIVGLTLYPQLVANVPSTASISGIFVSTFLAGWGASSLMNNIIATTGNGGSGTTPVPGPTPTPVPAPAKKPE